MWPEQGFSGASMHAGAEPRPRPTCVWEMTVGFRAFPGGSGLWAPGPGPSGFQCGVTEGMEAPTALSDP